MPTKATNSFAAVNVPVFQLAGFEVIFIGRICVIAEAKRTPPILRYGWKFSRMTTVPSLRQPRMPSVQPITSTRSPPRRSSGPARLDSCRVFLENQVSESAHIYRLDDGRLRLTFVHSSPDADSATFLSELGDFERWQAEEWLKDHLHPTADFDALLKPLEAVTFIKQTGSTQWYRCNTITPACETNGETTATHDRKSVNLKMMSQQELQSFTGQNEEKSLGSWRGVDRAARGQRHA
jgi:hypothetical protein